MVSHDILLNKLGNSDLSINTQNWIKYFLSGQHQCVHVNNTRSPFQSILVPLLFSIYINYLQSVYNDGNLSMYADDYVLYDVGKMTGLEHLILEIHLTKYMT